ncbi:MAG: DUF1934 family protein [Erysipelothrix sp.]|nr:DUF1934 family protein [Erysipelothrix sp.]
MIDINQIIKLYKIQNNKKQLVFKERGVVDRFPTSTKIKIDTVGLFFELELKRDELYLLRKAQDIVTEGLFHLQKKTRLVVVSEIGETLFDVETLSYELFENRVNFEYELFASNESVERFRFEVEY